MSNNCFYSAFAPQENMVKEFDYWIIIAREDQDTLGDCLFVLKREISTFGAMTSSESIELQRAFKWYEEKCFTLFGAEKFNYIAAMMRDNFVHFHAFPRYSHPVYKYGVEWVDSKWPRVIQFQSSSCPPEILKMIVSDMRD